MAGASSQSGMKAALILIGKRFASSLLTLLMVSVTIFIIAQLLPGDAAQEALGQSATADQVAAPPPLYWGIHDFFQQFPETSRLTEVKPPFIQCF